MLCTCNLRTSLWAVSIIVCTYPSSLTIHDRWTRTFHAWISVSPREMPHVRSTMIGVLRVAPFALWRDSSRICAYNVYLERRWKFSWTPRRIPRTLHASRCLPLDVRKDTTGKVVHDEQKDKGCGSTEGRAQTSYTCTRVYTTAVNA